MKAGVNVARKLAGAAVLRLSPLCPSLLRPRLEAGDCTSLSFFFSLGL